MRKEMAEINFFHAATFTSVVAEITRVLGVDLQLLYQSSHMIMWHMLWELTVHIIISFKSY